jgi:hypothetical protein
MRHAALRTGIDGLGFSETKKIQTKKNPPFGGLCLAGCSEIFGAWNPDADNFVLLVRLAHFMGKVICGRPFDMHKPRQCNLSQSVLSVDIGKDYFSVDCQRAKNFD